MMTTETEVPPTRDDVLLFLRTAAAITAMIAEDVQAGVYGLPGRPNFNSLQVFMAVMAGAYVGQNDQMKEDTGFGGGIEDMRKIANDFLELVKKIPAEQGRKPGMKVGPDFKTWVPCVSDGERADLLRMLDYNGEKN